MASTNEADHVADSTALRAVVGAPNPGSINKEMRALDESSRQFLSMATILFISSVGADGKADVSPRGDFPGFIKILDARTVAIPGVRAIGGPIRCRTYSRIPRAPSD
jgi:uncharacterized protein